MHMGKPKPAPECWDEAVDVHVGVTAVSCWYREVLRGTCSVPWEPGCWYHRKGLGRSEMFDQIFSKRQESKSCFSSCLSPTVHGDGIASRNLFQGHRPWMQRTATVLPRVWLWKTRDRAKDTAQELKSGT